MQSGIIPYEYAHGGRRFEAKPFPIGISGILLEQAQFVLTAEYRKWTGNTYPANFYAYGNINDAPYGPYEPKADGSTLAGSGIYVDNVFQTREALNVLLQLYKDDTAYNSHELSYRAGWLQSLFPESPSGFIRGDDDQAFFSDIQGHWRHRYPSEVGVIDYASDEVLGSSGVFYDIDFAEVMFNPAPHLGRTGFDDAHGPRRSGSNYADDYFYIYQYPLFPNFQRTDGTIIDIYREPSIIKDRFANKTYDNRHIASGYIRINGYQLNNLTKFVLSNGIFFDTSTNDFNWYQESIRVPYGCNRNVLNTVGFIEPTIQSSGIYRIAAVNKFNDFTNTTIESGIFSHWPPLVIENNRYYWPSDLPFNTTANIANVATNAGYQVFDDCIWMLDRSSISASNQYPSGLATLSPFNGHYMWIRYADMTPVTLTFRSGSTATTNWSTMVGLTRRSANSILRLSRRLENPVDEGSAKARFVFAEYDDSLDYLTSFSTTSPYNVNGYVYVGSDTGVTNHFWNGNNKYYIALANPFFLYRFSSSFDYENKYIMQFEENSSTTVSAITFDNAFYYNSQNYACYSSGIYPITFVEGTDPEYEGADTPEVGTATISYLDVKFIDGQRELGNITNKRFFDILSVLNVTSATHVPTGVYALCVLKTGSGPSDTKNLYLLQLEEQSTYWQIKSHTLLETGAFGTYFGGLNVSSPLDYTHDYNLRNLLYMPY